MTTRTPDLLKLFLPLLVPLMLMGATPDPGRSAADIPESIAARAAVQADTTFTVGVLDLQATNVDSGEVLVISSRLRAFVNRQPVFQLIERAEMVSLLEEVGFQQMGACADDECLVLLVEKKSTLHTGDVVTGKTRSIEEQLGDR